MKERLGHFCSICKCRKPNERFSGKGHARHICRDCQKLPASEREAIEQPDEIFGYLRQSHISAKNIARLRELVGSENAHVAELAAVVLEVAKVKPHKKRRLKFLARERRDLLRKLDETGLIMAHW